MRTIYLVLVALLLVGVPRGFADEDDPFAPVDKKPPAGEKRSPPPEITRAKPAAAPRRKSEAEIHRQLDQPTVMEFFETPLSDVIMFLEQQHGIAIVLDVAALQNDGRDSSIPVTIQIGGISLRSGLRLMLQQERLTFVVEDEAISITTLEAAEGKQETRVYPVLDLILARDPEADPFEPNYGTLISPVMAVIAPDSWDAVGGPGTVAEFDGNLIISQSHQVHRQLGEFFAALRTVRRNHAEDAKRVKTPVIFSGGSPAEQAIREQLSLRLDVKFFETALFDVVQSLSDRFGKTPFIIDRRALKVDGMDATSTLNFRANNAPLQTILRHALREVGLVHVVRDEVVLITTPSAAERMLSVRLYPVYDMVRQDRTDADLDSLVNAIVATIAPDSWNRVGGPGEISIWSEPATLVIAQSDDSHKQIERLLGNLRRVRAEIPHPDNANAVPAADVFTWNVYHLPHDGKGTSTFTVEKVASLLQRAIELAVADGPPDGIMVEVVGPNVIAVRANLEVRRAVEKTLIRLGIMVPWSKATRGSVPVVGSLHTVPY